MLRAVYSGLPVVRVGRGNPEGFVSTHDPSFIGGSNLTATKVAAAINGRNHEARQPAPRR